MILIMAFLSIFIIPRPRQGLSSNIHFFFTLKILTLCPLSVIINLEVMIIYSTKEASRKLGLSPDHVRYLTRKGDIKGKKLGHDWVVLSLDYKRKRKPKAKKGESNAKS